MKRLILKLCLLSVLGGVYAYAAAHPASGVGPLIKAKCSSGGSSCSCGDGCACIAGNGNCSCVCNP